MGVKRARTYTVEERQRGVEEAGRLGVSAASKKLGIPAGTLSCWLFLSKRHSKLFGGDAEASQGSAAGAGIAPSEGPESSTKAVQKARGPAPLESAPRPPKAQRTVARRYTPSERAAILEHASAHGPAATRRKYGVSRFSIRDWGRKTAAAAAGGSAPAPTTGSDTDPGEERERRVLREWRAHPGLGPSQVRNQLRRAGYKVSVHSCRVIMEKHGYVTPTIRREEVDGNRYEAIRPNALWLMASAALCGVRPLHVSEGRDIARASDLQRAIGST